MNTNQNETSITQNQNHVQEEVSDVVDALITSVATSNDSGGGPGPSAGIPHPVTEPPHSSVSVKPTYEIYRACGQQLAESCSGMEAGAEVPTVPPTYSTVMKQDRLQSRDLRRDVRSMEFQHISPFRRVPPPSYSEIQGTWSRVSGDYMSTTSSEQILFGPEPIFIWCNRCTTVVVSSTTSERSKFTHFTAAALCLFGCWPCAMLPYCMSACKNTYHYCPDCNYLLGTYRPW